MLSFCLPAPPPLLSAQEAGRWVVSAAYPGHESSIEDLQWSPTEETVFVSCSADKTIRVWDSRERSKAMLAVQVRGTIQGEVLGEWAWAMLAVEVRGTRGRFWGRSLPPGA